MIAPQDLTNFGLSIKEAKVYLAALELGMSSVQKIALKAGIHRVSTYDILSSLKQQGYVSSTIKGKKSYVIAVEPQKIFESLKSRQETFKNLLPELAAIQNMAEHKPKVMYYEGKSAVWAAYFDRIRYKPNLKTNLVYGSSEKLLTIFPDGYKEFTQERVAKGIKAKIIVERSRAGLLEAKLGDKELREVKFLPPGTNFKANTIIYANRVMIISWDSMLAIIIEDKNNAENQRILFNLLWQYVSE